MQNTIKRVHALKNALERSYRHDRDGEPLKSLKALTEAHSALGGHLFVADEDKEVCNCRGCGWEHDTWECPNDTCNHPEEDEIDEVCLAGICGHDQCTRDWMAEAKE